MRHNAWQMIEIVKIGYFSRLKPSHLCKCSFFSVVFAVSKKLWTYVILFAELYYLWFHVGAGIKSKQDRNSIWFFHDDKGRRREIFVEREWRQCG